MKCFSVLDCFWMSDSKKLKRLKKNLQIKFEPENAKPVAHYKSFFMETTPTIEEKRDLSGYVSDFMATGEPGILVHGSSIGKISIVMEGIREYGGDVCGKYHTPREFYHYLIRRHSLDLAKDKRPLHLICCYSGMAKENSGKLSIAQELANITQRKIWAYGGYEKVRSLTGGLFLMINNTDEITNINKVKLEPKLIEPHRPEFIRIKTNSSSRC